MFREVPLQQATVEFNRYNSTKLELGDRSLQAFHVGGTFRATNVEAFVRLLEQGFALHVERSGGRIILTRSDRDGKTSVVE